MEGRREFLRGVNEGRGKTKIQYGLTKPKTETVILSKSRIVSRLRSPPKNEFMKIRRHQFNRDPDYKCGFHLSFLSLVLEI